MKARIIFFVLAFPPVLFAQNNLREKHISVIKDTILLDSLSIVPKTFSSELDSAFYKIDFAKSILIWNREKLSSVRLNSDSVKISYQTFPFNFSEEHKHKDIKNLQPDRSGAVNPFNYTYDKTKEVDIFKTTGLNKNGSISRGISFGNNQDVVVNSSMNLNLSGKLSDNIDILLSSSDQNIPIQPEGNTQQLQEFDKVFIQLSNQNAKLIAGDFQLSKPAGYFMNFNKKAQGLSFATNFNTGKNSDKNKTGKMLLTASGAVSKGKFSRMVFNGVENNQGPYKLRGAENEPFIIVLSGTEKVFIDGELMERGQENDYVIDYNTAEIIFTAKRLITKDKRIVVEFQYSDKNYARSLFHVGDEFSKGKLKTHVNFYSEQDSKNKPLQQDLDDEQKLLLTSIGDSLNSAVTPNIDSVAFNDTEVLYEKKDTVIGWQTFNDIFVYSTDSSAHFRLGFSLVGANKGNYVQINASANGKVFKWVMPDTVSGIPNGSYEPVILLITPKKKQMLTAGADYVFSKNSKMSVEGAITNNDINTFSRFGKNNDQGVGVKFIAENRIPLGSDSSGWKIIADVNYELMQQTFSPIERFRPVEFERDWNLLNRKVTADQHIAAAKIGAEKKNTFIVTHQFAYFIEGSDYNATRNLFSSAFTKKGWLVAADASLLDAKTTLNKSQFIRHKAEISRKKKSFKVGVKEEQEINEFREIKTDTLQVNSFSFLQWMTFADFGDTSLNKFGLSYKQRYDYAPKNNSLIKSTYGEDIGANIGLMKNPSNGFKGSVTFRRLFIYDTLLTALPPDNSLIGRGEYNFSLKKGFLTSGTFYEIGSGLEPKKEFSFIQVAPGQGVYIYGGDYNGNGIKDLNEFEVAPFANEADYIKVYTPTDQYEKTYTNQFSEVLNVKPIMIWNQQKGIKGCISRFSNQTTYRADRKSKNKDLGKSYNPFLKEPDDSLLVSLNSSLRNTVFFNQSSSVFGMDYTYSDNRNKTLLTNGFDARINSYHETRTRWNITRKWTLLLNYKEGRKRSKNEFFSNRDYTINYLEAEPKISFQPNTQFRTSISYKYTEKKNTPDLGGQQAVLQNVGTEIKYNTLNKGSMILKGNYIQITYDDSQNSSLAFEMLEGLKIGQNITWGLSYQRTLSNNLQMSIGYNGRKSEGIKIIHTGTAQVRAFF